QSSASRDEDGVAILGNLPSQHHRVILVDRVVAVQRVPPDEITEPEEQLDALVLPQPRDVLPTDVERYRPASGARYELMFLEVNVNRMRPVTRQIGQNPVFDAVLLDAKPGLLAVHELTVDRPLAVQPVELERADRAGRFGGVRLVVALDNRRRILAAV